MTSPVYTLLRRVTRGDKLNILTFATHERYESMWAKTGHNFYAVQGHGYKQWVTHYAPIPDNYHLLDGDLGDNQIPAYLDFDLVVSQHPEVHLPIAFGLSQQLSVPLLCIWHTLPPEHYDAVTMMTYKQQKIDPMRPFHNVFISEFNRDVWNMEGDVIHHGVDSDFWCPGDEERKKYVLAVVNDWINRDYVCNFNQWDQGVIKAGIPNKVFGDTPGFSRPAKGPEHLRDEYRQAVAFVNTANWSPIPTSMLEAMACGCVPISINRGMAGSIIKDGYNGLLFEWKDPQGLTEACKKVLGNPDRAKEVGKSARETVRKLFNMDRFVEEWDAALQKAAGNV